MFVALFLQQRGFSEMAHESSDNPLGRKTKDYLISDSVRYAVNRKNPSC
jgi:hypothetical protein